MEIENSSSVRFFDFRIFSAGSVEYRMDAIWAKMKTLSRGKLPF